MRAIIGMWEYMRIAWELSGGIVWELVRVSIGKTPSSWTGSFGETSSSTKRDKGGQGGKIDTINLTKLTTIRLRFVRIGAQKCMAWALYPTRRKTPCFSYGDIRCFAEGKNLFRIPLGSTI